MIGTLGNLLLISILKFVLFPGNFGYLWGSKLEYFSTRKFHLGKLWGGKYVYTHAHTRAHTLILLIHRDRSPCAHSQ